MTDRAEVAEGPGLVHDDDDDGNARPARREIIGGLVKGLAIIEAFGPDRPHMTITAAANATGISPAAARRCMLTLSSLGYLTYDGKYFRPAPRLARLGASHGSFSPLSLLAQPCLDAVRDEVGESCSLAVLDGEYVAFIARSEAARIVTTAVRLGARLPSHASATGRVLLGSLPDDELERRLGQISPKSTTVNTLTSISAIRKRIEDARGAAIAFTDEELELGIRTMAVPVVDVDGETHAAMSLSAPITRVSLEEMEAVFAPVLKREAARLGAML